MLHKKRERLSHEHDRAWRVARFAAGKVQRIGLVGEDTAAAAVLIAGHPLIRAVPANEEAPGF